jgi:hypothetical protein
VCEAQTKRLADLPLATRTGARRSQILCSARQQTVSLVSRLATAFDGCGGPIAGAVSALSSVMRKTQSGCLSGLAAAKARGVVLGRQIGQRPSDKKAKRVLALRRDGSSAAM